MLLFDILNTQGFLSIQEMEIFLKLKDTQTGGHHYLTGTVEEVEMKGREIILLFCIFNGNGIRNRGITMRP